jgi:environmental stress-induced protein Ves
LTSPHAAGPSDLVHRYADATAMPWRNGGGVTRELLRRPAGTSPGADFDWRLSIADVAADGPFSSFAGYDRILVLLSGAGMDLLADGEVVALRAPFGRLRFVGEASVHAVLIDGPTTDLNLIWRRGSFDVNVRRFEAPFDLAPQTGATLLAVVAEGAPSLDDGVALRPGDVVESTDILHVDGTGTLFVFALVPR